MIHDYDLIDRLSALPTMSFSGEVFRATRMNLDPTTPTSSGGRWSIKTGTAVLYTSLAREGALAEIAFHWSRMTPINTKPVLVHCLAVETQRTLRLARADLGKLGVDMGRFGSLAYERTKEIGATAAFIGLDGLIVPSARWECEHLVLFPENLGLEVTIAIVASEEVDWLAWARGKGLPIPPPPDVDFGAP